MKHWYDSLISGQLKTKLKYEFWPAEEESSTKVLIVLHGRGDSSEGFHWLPQNLEIENFHYLFLNAPDEYGSGYSWYDLPPRQGPGIVRSRALLTELVGSLAKECGLQSTDLFLFGFSQGCLMSLDLALRYPEPLGGVVGASGYIFFLDEYPEHFGSAAKSQHIFMTHGPEDEVVPLAPTKASVDILKRQGIHIDWREYSKTHTMDPSHELPDIKAFYKNLLNMS